LKKFNIALGATLCITQPLHSMETVKWLAAGTLSIAQSAVQQHPYESLLAVSALVESAVPGYGMTLAVTGSALMASWNSLNTAAHFINLGSSGVSSSAKMLGTTGLALVFAYQVTGAYGAGVDSWVTLSDAKGAFAAEPCNSISIGNFHTEIAYCLSQGGGLQKCSDHFGASIASFQLSSDNIATRSVYDASLKNICHTTVVPDQAPLQLCLYPNGTTTLDFLNRTADHIVDGLKPGMTTPFIATNHCGGVGFTVPTPELNPSGNLTCAVGWQSRDSLPTRLCTDISAPDRLSAQLAYPEEFGDSPQFPVLLSQTPEEARQAYSAGQKVRKINERLAQGWSIELCTIFEGDTSSQLHQKTALGLDTLTTYKSFGGNICHTAIIEGQSPFQLCGSPFGYRLPALPADQATGVFLEGHPGAIIPHNGKIGTSIPHTRVGEAAGTSGLSFVNAAPGEGDETFCAVGWQALETQPARICIDPRQPHKFRTEILDPKEFPEEPTFPLVRMEIHRREAPASLFQTLQAAISSWWNGEILDARAPKIVKQEL